jgi:hypothetical protein
MLPHKKAGVSEAERGLQGDADQPLDLSGRNLLMMLRWPHTGMAVILLVGYLLLRNVFRSWVILIAVCVVAFWAGCGWYFYYQQINRPEKP